MDRREARAILGLPPTFSRDELEAAFRRRASEFHPDRQGDVRRFQDVVESRRVLAARDASPSRVVLVDDRPRLARWVQQMRRRPGPTRHLL